MNRKIRILLADDHAVVRQGFRLILNQEPDMEVVGEAGDGAEAVRLVLELRPTLVIMDIAMPRVNGVEATRRILEACTDARVLILSMHKDAVYVRETLRAGATISVRSRVSQGVTISVVLPLPQSVYDSQDTNSVSR